MNISVTPHYSRSFSGYIWRIKQDEYTGKLWFEVRDETNFEVNLFWVDLGSGEQGQFVSEPAFGWWDSLMHVHGGILCMQQVKDTANPGPADLQLINSEDQSESDVFTDLLIEAIRGNSIQVDMKGERQEILLTDLESQSGGVIDFREPEVYPEGHEYHAIVTSYLEKIEKKEVVGPILYMENRGIIIVFHSKENGDISRTLVWIRDDQVILKEVIDEKMSGYSNESFFTIANYLIFIENRRTVKVHLLHNV